MRHLSFFWLTFTALLFALPSWAQFSSDISNPLIVADSAVANAGDGHVRALPDGSGGHYIFWLDGRGAQPRDKRLYGQHLSAQGARLWGNAGKLIARAMQPYPSTLWEFEAVLTPQGDIIACYNEGDGGQDSLYAIRINPTDGSLAWRKYVVGRTPLAGGRILYVTAPQMIATASGIYLSYHLALLYYSDQLHFNKIDRNGNLPWGSRRGPWVPSAVFGPSYLLPGANGGGLLVWREANGAGAHMWARGFNPDSTLIGTEDKDLTLGTNGLAYELAPVPDSAGGALVPYVTNDQPTELWAVRINQQAGLLWSPVRKAISSGTGRPVIAPLALRNGGRTYVTWGGLRAGTTGTYDVYIQALSDAGAPLWTVNGTLALAEASVYGSYAKLAPTQDGGVVFASQTANGVYAQRLRPDGTVAWDSLCHITDQPHNTALRDFELLANGPNFDIIWRTGLGAVHATRVSADGRLGVTTATRPGIAQILSITPNPAQSQIQLKGILNPSILTVRNSLGQAFTIKRSDPGYDVSALPPGLYTLTLGERFARFVKE